ncbi:MAG: hypothetical protein GQ527_07400, partial [Bacteroidales bacterium]|nr:hypothetical protein [Bacteroidales bacterium]
MYKETTNIQRIIAAVVAVVAGIYFVVWAPSQAMWTLKHALEAVMDRLIPFDPDFYTAVPILGATFGIWMLLLAFGGSLLLVVAYGIYKGNLQARAAALGVAGIAAVAGMTMFIPWMVLIVSDYSQGPVSGISPPPADTIMTPPVLWIMVIGLAAYFTFLLMDKDSIKDKIFKSIVYTAIGVVAGMVFMNAQHGVRYFAFIPEYQTESNSLKPLGNVYTNLDHYDAIALTTVSQKQMDNIEYGQEIDLVRKAMVEGKGKGKGKHKVDRLVLKNKQAIYDPNTIALLLGGYGNYIASYLMVFLIPFVFLRQRWAYNALLMSTVLSAIATFQNYFVRGSFEWAIGGIMSLGLLVFLLL